MAIRGASPAYSPGLVEGSKESLASRHVEHLWKARDAQICDGQQSWGLLEIVMNPSGISATTIRIPN